MEAKARFGKKIVEKIVTVPQEKFIEVLIEKWIEKIVEVPVTNTLKQLEVTIEKIVERVVQVPRGNTIEVLNKVDFVEVCGEAAVFLTTPLVTCTSLGLALLCK